MGIDQRIPDLSDKELESLHANAVRLVESGSAVQRRKAEELLPLLGVALEERRVARVAAHTQTRRTNARNKAANAQGAKETSDDAD
jgi:hypothetical protein